MAQDTMAIMKRHNKVGSVMVNIIKGGISSFHNKNISQELTNGLK